MRLCFSQRLSLVPLLLQAAAPLPPDGCPTLLLLLRLVRASAATLGCPQLAGRFTIIGPYLPYVMQLCYWVFWMA